jgi:CheY-like chemotaxis protein
MIGAKNSFCFGKLTRFSIVEKPMLVLVVDDIPLNRDIAVALLSKENCKCDVAVDGVEAVTAFKQKAYPLPRKKLKLFSNKLFASVAFAKVTTNTSSMISLFYIFFFYSTV